MLPLRAREERSWAAYEAVHGPLEPIRGDITAARIVHKLTLLLMAWTAKAGTEAPELAEFVIDWDQRTPEPEDLLAKVLAANQAYVGKDNRVGRS